MSSKGRTWFYAPPSGNKLAHFTRLFTLFSRIEGEIKIVQPFFCLPADRLLDRPHPTTGGGNSGSVSPSQMLPQIPRNPSPENWLVNTALTSGALRATFMHKIKSRPADPPQSIDRTSTFARPSASTRSRCASLGTFHSAIPPPSSDPRVDLPGVCFINIY